MNRLRAAIVVTAGSFVLFGTAAAVPIWAATGPQDAESGNHRILPTYREGPLWQADLIEESWYRAPNRIQLALLVSVVTIAWLIAYRCLARKRRPDAAGDYEEKEGGSMSDGRAEMGDPPRAV